MGNVYKGLDTAPSRTATRLRVVLKSSLEPFEAQSLGLQRLHSAVVLPMNKVYQVSPASAAALQIRRLKR